MAVKSAMWKKILQKKGWTRLFHVDNSQRLPGVSLTSLFCIHKVVPLSQHYLCFTEGEAKSNPSKDFQHCSDRARNRSGVPYHSTTHDSKVHFLPSSSFTLQRLPSIRSNLPISEAQSAELSGHKNGVFKEQDWRLACQLPSLQISSPTDIYICLGNRFVTQPIFQSIFCFSLSCIFCPYQTRRSIPAAFSEVWDGTKQSLSAIYFTLIEHY